MSKKRKSGITSQGLPDLGHRGHKKRSYEHDQTLKGAKFGDPLEDIYDFWLIMNGERKRTNRSK